MKRDTALVLVIAAALLVVAFQTTQLIGLTNTVKTTGLATSQASQASQASQGSSQSEYDQMMQEMHPDQVQKSSAPAGQIGGC